MSVTVGEGVDDDTDRTRGIVNTTLAPSVEPVGVDLSFLSSIELWVEAPDLDAVLIASADSFPEGESLVVFDIEDVDLTDYVVSRSMTITTEVTGHRPDQDTLVEARFDLAVGVTGQGACNYIKGDTASE